MAINEYLDLLTSQYRTKPKLTQWLSKKLEKVDDSIYVLKSMNDAFDVDKAIGKQQDILGSVVGASRNLPFNPASSSTSVLEDEDFRTATKAKISRNNWDGTIPGMYDVWNASFPNANLQIVDNQDMTMQATINGPISNVAREMITAGLIIPKPTGVKLTIIESTEISEGAFIGMIVTGFDRIEISTNVPV